MSSHDFRSGHKRCLRLRGAPKTHRRPIIAHHLILHGYGHWFPNDPRGSGSDEVR